MTGRVRDERGLVLPARLMVLGVSAVALSGLVFIATQHDDGDAVSPASGRPTTSATSTPTPHSSPTTSTSTPSAGSSDIVVAPTTTAPPPPVVRRRQIAVVVFNNSNITGLAGRTATAAQRHGWNVVGSDNWYGSIDTSTVYFGTGLKEAARLLARDLGITSVKPFVAPMRADRVTVILTSTYKPS
jgi:hypothetical protein